MSATRAYHRNARVRWAREEALPAIVDLIGKQKYVAALDLGRQAEWYIASDSRLRKLWPEMSREIDIHTTPEGADVSFREYGAASAQWRHLGRAPIVRARIPVGFFEWQVIKEGYRTVFAASSGQEGRIFWFPGMKGGSQLHTRQGRRHPARDGTCAGHKLCGGHAGNRIASRQARRLFHRSL